MRRRVWLIFVVGLSVAVVPAVCAEKTLGLELAVGGLVHPDVFGGVDEYGENYFYGTVSAGVNVPIAHRLDFGVWVGYLHNSPYLPDARIDRIWPLAFPLTYGVKAVIGDRKNGIGVSINFGVTPSIGLYFRNWFVNGMIGLITTEYGSQWVPGEEPIVYKPRTRVYPYIELGYCFEL